MRNRGSTHWAAVAVVATAALVTGGCGSSGGSGTTAKLPAAQATTNAGTTHPTTTTAPTTTIPPTTRAKTATTTPTAPQYQQPVAAVSAPTQTLKAGPLTSSLAVTRIADPLKAFVDTPQKGNKLVGIFVRGETQGPADPADTANATLVVTNGESYPLRLIADGDCGGGSYIPSGWLSAKKPTTGCLGFEIPKGSKPKQLDVSLSAVLPEGKKGEKVLGTTRVAVSLPQS